jgi:AcrR family transcriptional regulator
MSVREYQKKRRRERIFQAAMALFRQRGFQETTASDIAKAAHVSRGTFFNYFPYKEAVLLEYGALLLAGLREEVKKRLARGEDPLAILRFIFQEVARYTEAEKDLVLPLLYELLNPDPIRAKAAFEALPLGDLIAQVLRPLREKDLVRKDLSLELQALYRESEDPVERSRWHAWAGPWLTSTSSPPSAGRPTPRSGT